MPELPEVESVVRTLRPHIVGRAVRALHLLDPRLDVGSVEDVEELRVRGIVRRAKLAVWQLARPRAREPSRWLAFHLGMTGRLVWWSGRGERPGPERELRAWLELDRGEVLFLDTRRLGRIYLVERFEELGSGGVEPLGEGFTVERLAELRRGSCQPIKVWLLRQDRISGLGNIYASEILFGARISPFRLAGTLDRDELDGLRATTIEVLTAAIEHGGTTFSGFRDARGRPGRHRDHLWVYGRAGEPCPRCDRPIERCVQQGRSTFWCPECQSNGSPIERSFSITDG